MAPTSAVRHARGPNPKFTERRAADGVTEAVWLAVPVRVPEPVGDGAGVIVLLLTAVAAYSSADWYVVQLLLAGAG
jgi:hypothetical protein